MEESGQVADQLAKIDAVLSGKVENRLLPAKQVFNAHGLHIELVLLCQAAEIIHGVLAHASKIVGMVKVLVRRNAQNGF